MTINDKIRDQKLQYDINREATNISASISIWTWKYQYEPFDQKWVIEQAKFTYSPIGKALEKRRKTIEDQGIKQVEALKALKPEGNQELE